MKTLKRMRFHMEVVWRTLYFYIKFPLSLRQVAELMLDRGVSVSHMSVYNWLIRFGPELEKKFRKYKAPVNGSWRVDETYIRIKGEWKYLYRAVDRHGQTVDFLLTAHRDLKAAKRFFKKAMKQNGSPLNATIDKSGANLAALEAVNEDRRNKIEFRQNRYLNNLVEQDHRSVKKRVRPMLGFKRFTSAKTIIARIEILAMIAKGQLAYLPLLHRTAHDAYWALVQA
jgi:transposase-like protein